MVALQGAKKWTTSDSSQRQVASSLGTVTRILRHIFGLPVVCFGVKSDINDTARKNKTSTLERPDFNFGWDQVFFLTVIHLMAIMERA